MGQRILVLGGGGFVGRHLVEALAAAAWASVSAPLRGRPLAGMPDGTAFDACNQDQLARLMRDADAVVNCVAGPPATIRSNARALFAAAASLRQPPRIVHLSSMAVYGDATGCVDETTPPDRRGRGYAAAKIEAEQAARDFGAAVVLRPGCIYGGGSPQWSARIARWLKAGRLGDLRDAGTGCSNLLHVDDLVQAVTTLLRDQWMAGECFNLAMSQAPSWNEYFQLVGRALGLQPLPVISGRRLAFESRVLAPWLKVLQLAAATSGLDRRALPEPMPPSLLRLFRQPITLDVRKAQSALGLSSRPLAETLQAGSGDAATGLRAGEPPLHPVAGG